MAKLHCVKSQIDAETHGSFQKTGISRTNFFHLNFEERQFSPQFDSKLFLFVDHKQMSLIYANPVSQANVTILHAVNSYHAWHQFAMTFYGIKVSLNNSNMKLSCVQCSRASKK